MSVPGPKEAIDAINACSELMAAEKAAIRALAIRDSNVAQGIVATPAAERAATIRDLLAPPAAAAAASTDTQRLCTILEEQRVILEQLRLPKHTIAVQGWSGQPSVYVPVSSYDELLTQLCHMFSSAAAAASSASAVAAPPPLRASDFTLYYVPPGLDPCAPFSVWFHVRQKVGSEDDLTRYICSFPSHARHPLLLWQRRIPADDAFGAVVGSSPKVPSPTKDEAPAQVPLASPTASPPSLGSPSVKSGSSGRSSTDQKPFAEAVYKRDGHRCVVADCATSPVQAAHVVPVREDRSAEDMQTAELLSLYEPQNGISLCLSCHDYLDAGLWYIDPEGSRNVMRVAVALSANDAAWQHRDGGAVRLPVGKALKQYWPPKRVLLVQKRFFELKLSERRADVLERPHACPTCARRFAAKGQAFRQHKKNCDARPMPANFRTPSKQKVSAAHKKKP